MSENSKVIYFRVDAKTKARLDAMVKENYQTLQGFLTQLVDRVIVGAGFEREPSAKSHASKRTLPLPFKAKKKPAKAKGLKKASVK